jgi:hypothetical protein
MLDTPVGCDSNWDKRRQILYLLGFVFFNRNSMRNRWKCLISGKLKIEEVWLKSHKNLLKFRCL